MYIQLCSKASFVVLRTTCSGDVGRRVISIIKSARDEMVIEMSWIGLAVFAAQAGNSF